MDTEPAGSSRTAASTLKLAAWLAVGATLLTGCANPGPPRPPSLQLPEKVSDLSAERIGDRVLLRWTTPSRTTDDFDIKGSLVAEICRTPGSPAPNAKGPLKKSASACLTVRHAPTLPGADSAWDSLPPELLADPVGLLTYRIQILNAAGRSGGFSVTAAYAASGAVPAPVVSLTASPSEAGGILRWKVPEGGDALLIGITRTNLGQQNPPAAATSTEQSIVAPAAPDRRGKGSSERPNGRADTGAVHLRASAHAKGQASPTGLAGTVDTTALMGETYGYVAEDIRFAMADGHALELRSEPTALVTLAMRDTFPPKPPTGLATVPGTTATAAGTLATSYIDLSWEPNSEPDLAGYLVYRQLARPNGDPQGPLGRMTPLPMAASAYRDVAVTPGQRYIYSVTAVDASGNESAPSAKAQEVAVGQSTGPPQ